MFSMKKLFASLALSVAMWLPVQAEEGMWIPMLLQQLNEAEMQDMGLELTAEDIYSVNQSSLKDAIVHFGGGCTAEVISEKGLLLTNHHCGYGEIQSHSSVEHDYLTDGFWAKNQSEELANPGLTATFIKYMKDVSAEATGGVSDDMSEADRQAKIKENIDAIKEKEVEGTHYKSLVRPFFKGNKYYMFVTETYEDVRLVGAPPSSIGKYGSDTDNWVWPRHTGDFSIFRIYADKDNKPAPYSADNVPYKPAHALEISLNGVQEDDFTMVFGFPGRTNEYLPSHAIRQTLEVLNPAKIQIRETSLNIMDAEMRKSDEIRIKYAAKYARVANYYKKWIGENTGLKETHAIAKKEKNEMAFQNIVNSNKAFADYKNLLSDFDKQYQAREELALARDYFVEIFYYGIGFTRFASGADAFVKSGKEEDLKKFLATAERQFKDYDGYTDEKIMAALLALYEKEVPRLKPSILAEIKKEYKGDFKAYAKAVFAKSILVDSKKFKALKKASPKKAAKMLRKDPAYKLTAGLNDYYRTAIYKQYYAINDEIDKLGRTYMKALMEVFPNKAYYPDANSTLRLTYGKVKAYAPKDAVDYHYMTYMDGVMEKYIPGDYEFDLPERLVKLYEKKSYGQYVDKNGKMPVCFISTNHTTGGNSGSPALNGKGQLVGLNFDRAWEGTMSDINYDSSRCRNIMVDIRYVLFIVDRFAGASYLVDEMKIVKDTEMTKM